MLARFGWESNWYRYVAEEVRVETVVSNGGKV